MTTFAINVMENVDAKKTRMLMVENVTNANPDFGAFLTVNPVSLRYDFKYADTLCNYYI